MSFLLLAQFLAVALGVVVRQAYEQARLGLTARNDARRQSLRPAPPCEHQWTPKRYTGDGAWILDHGRCMLCGKGRGSW